MLEGFDFSAPSLTSRLVGRLADLKRYNGLIVPVEYFFEAMNRLRRTYLDISLDAVPHRVAAVARQAAEEQQAAAANAPLVKENELTAQKWYELGFEAVTAEEKLRCFTEAIRLQPASPYPFAQRGIVQRE